MEKKKTTDEEHDLSYYLGDNEKETSSKTTEQKDRFIPKWEEIRKQGNRTPVNQSGIPSENSEHELHVVLSQDAVPSGKATLLCPLWPSRICSCWSQYYCPL